MNVEGEKIKLMIEIYFFSKLVANVIKGTNIKLKVTFMCFYNERNNISLKLMYLKEDFLEYP